MSTFRFAGKTIRIVEDAVGDLVAGCERCVFHDDTCACAMVDGVGTGRVRCSDGNHHYEEVKDAYVQ